MYVVGQENIHEINFDNAINDALDVSDYRLAIRLQYLKTLKMLSLGELINWKPNRTNYSYVSELERYPYQADFAQITSYFEFTWYGDFKVDEAGYKEMKAFSETLIPIEILETEILRHMDEPTRFSMAPFYFFYIFILI